MMLNWFGTRQDDLGVSRTNLAHPNISKSDLHNFVKTIKLTVHLHEILTDLEHMYIWRDDKQVKLFCRLTTSSSSFILLLLFNTASFFYITNVGRDFNGLVVAGGGFSG